MGFKEFLHSDQTWEEYSQAGPLPIIENRDNLDDYIGAEPTVPERPKNMFREFLRNDLTWEEQLVQKGWEEPEKAPFTPGRLVSQMGRGALQGAADIARGISDIEEQYIDLPVQPESQSPLMRRNRELRADLERDPYYQQRTEAAEQIDPIYDYAPEMLEGSSGMIEDALGGMARFAPAMALGATPAGIGATFSTLVGMKSKEYQEAGVDKEHAVNAALLAAALSTPVEFLGNVFQLGQLKRLLKGVKVSDELVGKILQKAGAIGKGGAAEGIEEFVQEHADEIANVYAEFPGMESDEIMATVWERLPETNKRAWEGLKVGALGGALLQGGGMVVGERLNLGREKPIDEDADKPDERPDRDLKKEIENITGDGKTPEERTDEQINQTVQAGNERIYDAEGRKRAEAQTEIDRRKSDAEAEPEVRGERPTRFESPVDLEQQEKELAEQATKGKPVDAKTEQGLNRFARRAEIAEPGEDSKEDIRKYLQGRTTHEAQIAADTVKEIIGLDQFNDKIAKAQQVLDENPDLMPIVERAVKGEIVRELTDVEKFEQRGGKQPELGEKPKEKPKEPKKTARDISKEARERGELTEGVLNAEVKEYKGTGGISFEARDKGYKPAFRHKKTGDVYDSKDDEGKASGVHLLGGIPQEFVTERDPDSGDALAVTGDIEAGFTRGGEFFTRDQVAKVKGATHKIGDTRSIMGEQAELVKQVEFEGVGLGLWRGEEGDHFIRVWDKEAKKVVGIKLYEDEKMASEKFGEIEKTYGKKETQTDAAGFVGKTWASKTGQRTVIGKATGRPEGWYEVQTEGEKHRQYSRYHYIHADDIDNEITFDTKNLASWKKQQAEVEAEEKEKAEKDKVLKDIDGFMDDATPMERGNAVKNLNQLRKFDGKTVSIKDKIRELVESGEATLKSWQENKIKPMSRRAYNRATQQEQDEHEQKMARAGKKTVYSVGGYELGKRAYDYAEYLEAKKGEDVTVGTDEIFGEGVDEKVQEELEEFVKGVPKSLMSGVSVEVTGIDSEGVKVKADEKGEALTETAETALSENERQSETYYEMLECLKS